MFWVKKVRVLLVIGMLITNLLNSKVYAQQQKDESELSPLKAYYHKKHQTTHDGMVVLSAWGGANLLSGIVGGMSTEGSTQYMFQMNALWGGVNLLISYSAFRSLQKKANDPVFLGYAEMDQKRTERLFLINAGLDVLYMGAGVGLLDYAKDGGVNQERIEGYGQSFLIQGAFLFGFDAIMYVLHRKNRNKNLNPLLENLELNGMGLVYHFH